MLIALWVVNSLLIAVVVGLIHRLRSQQASRRTSEEQYRTIFETVADGLIINSLDGVVVEANPAACKMHGYTRAEFIGQSAAEFVHPDSLHLFHEYVEALSVGRSFHCFAQDLRKDGSVFDVEVDGIPFQFEGRPHLLGIVRDVTERKLTLDALKKSEELNRRIVEAVPAGIVHVAQYGTILNANARAQHFLGVSLDELTQQYVKDFDSTSIYEDGSVCDVEDFPVSRCLKTGKPHGPLTLGVSRPDGTVGWAMFVAVPVTDPENGRQNGAIVTFLDITARKQAEQDLSESEERFRLLAENAPGVIYLCRNDERYTMIFISDQVEDLTGYAKEDFLTDRMSFVELYHPDDRTHIGEEVERAIKDQGPFRLHYRIRHKSGEYRWIDEVGVGVRREGELAFLEGFLDDVTDKVRADEALKHAQQALIDQQRREHERVKAELERVQNHLVHSTRLATIGKMAAQIAHEIRNPLGTIKNAAFFVARKLPAEEILARENVERIQNEVSVCVEIIENILSITKIQPPRKSPLDLKPFVEEAFERLRQKILEDSPREEPICRFRAETNPCSVLVDHGQFRQVLDNLLKNAVEAIGGGGEITVTARNTPDETVIEISDNGPGVPADRAEKIFEVFQTSKARGTGLGLGICRQIVERHAGTLKLKPPEDSAEQEPRGATFVIRLPREEALAP